MKNIAKNTSLVVLIFSISSAVSNWGGDLTENPLIVFAALFASVIFYSIADLVVDD